MKTIVLKLDAHDDLISVRDKMVWSKAQRILLVWPNRGRPNLTRKYDLVSLQRHAIALGAQLGLVTRDLEVGANARELGVAVFRSEKQAQRQRWNRTRVRRRFRRRIQNPDRVNELRGPLGEQKPPAFLLGWSRLIIFTIGVLAVLALGMFLLPGATVKIKPAQQEQKVAMTLTIDPNLAALSLNGIIPAETVSTIVEVQGQLATTGRASIPDQTARGMVTFTNLTDRSLTLAVGSIILAQDSSAQRFVTTREVILPAGDGMMVTAPVEAAVNGTGGNLPAETVFSMEGTVGPDVLVSNAEAFTGGKDRSLPAVSKSDLEKLRRQLMDTITASAKQDLAAALREDQHLLEDSVALVQVLEESMLPAVGSPGDTLNLSLRAEFKGLAVSMNDVDQLAKASLDANLGDDRFAIPSSLSVKTLSTPVETSDGRLAWSVTATRKTILKVSEDAMLKAIMSKRPSVAAANLAAILDLEKPPAISLSPSWWFWMPSMGFRVQFEVE